MKYHFRKASVTDIPQIWKIIQQAIVRRMKDGSQQWQDGYPNEEVIERDVAKSFGYVLTANSLVVGYAAVLFNDEPEYERLRGTWLTNGDYVVVHRIALLDEYLGKGLAQKMFLFIEDLAIVNTIFSIKVDTNFDNIPMLKILENLNYVYCGEVSFRGSHRRAYEKILSLY